ncbi:MAG: hypothetical protein ACK5V1_05450 [Planctomycetaceae bacterium]
MQRRWLWIGLSRASDAAGAQEVAREGDVQWPDWIGHAGMATLG